VPSTKNRTQVAEAPKGTVYIQYIGDQQVATTLATALTAAGYTVEPLQRVTQDFRSNVRYFHEDDAKQAAELAALVHQSIASVSDKPALLPGFETRVPLRQFEVWIRAGP
jgi:hypothetical protein